MVDKYEAKQYVADKIGEEYIIPTLGVWNSFDEIDFESLPDKFVLKCTHDSGGLVICKDKKSLDKDKARTKIEKSLKNNYYLWGREWPYKNVKPRIIAEQFMVDSKTEDLRDFKFFCFGGQVRCFKVDFDRFIEHRANYYDEKSHILNFGEVMCPPDYNKKIELPKSIGKMEKLAQKLAEEHPFLRADFYDVDGKVYFGEMTFYPASGFGAFTDDEWDKLLGSWIPMGMDVIVSNLVNTMYCRDAGKKLRTANQVKWRKGITTASAAPFGYQFDPDKKGAFIVDPPAAKIVRRIFDLAILGLGNMSRAFRML